MNAREIPPDDYPAAERELLRGAVECVSISLFAGPWPPDQNRVKRVFPLCRCPDLTGVRFTNESDVDYDYWWDLALGSRPHGITAKAVFTAVWPERTIKVYFDFGTTRRRIFAMYREGLHPLLGITPGASGVDPLGAGIVSCDIDPEDSTFLAALRLADRWEEEEGR